MLYATRTVTSQSQIIEELTDAFLRAGFNIAKSRNTEQFEAILEDAWCTFTWIFEI